MLFFILSLLGLLFLFLGLVKPSILKTIYKTVPSRKKVFATFGSGVLVCFIIFAILAPDPTDSTTGTNSISTKDSDKNQEQQIDEEKNINFETDIEVSTSTQTITQDEQEHNQVKEDVGQQENTLDSSQQETNNTPFYLVVSVVDGDTIKVDIDETVETLRLIGIDTPETVHPSKPVECFGKEASSKANELLSGKKVQLEADVTQGDRDVYGRLLRYLYLPDGTLFNKLMVSEGYAYEYTYKIPYKYQIEFKQAQSLAQENNRGLWADGVCDSYVSPNETNESDPVVVESETPQATGYKYYTSSHYSAKFYYCETDPGWQGLSTKYLQVYDSENQLLTDHPDHVLHEPCD